MDTTTNETFERASTSDHPELFVETEEMRKKTELIKQVLNEKMFLSYVSLERLPENEVQKLLKKKMNRQPHVVIKKIPDGAFRRSLNKKKK